MSDEVRFPSSLGPDLAGVLDVPEESARGWGVLVHGFTLGKDSPAAFRIARGLAAQGIGMLRFDCLGLGESEGEWGDGSFTVKVDDTVRAAEFLAERGTPPTLLIGHSWGGAAAIVAAQRIPSVKAVVTIGAPAEPAEVERHYDSVVDRVMAEGTAPWLVGGREMTLKRDFVQDVRGAELIARVHTLDRPLLVMHSPTDATVSIDNASEIFRAAVHPRSFIALEGSDHLLTADGQAERAARIISAWAEQYL
ncbi:osmotically inducible protein OsmC [Brachybacterium vulturis]|uniref:Osmotically inducible protein OsmC n=1 Tax=Brachybacterium vulturis TaxID=2017484 RepID=A0A291GL58_9MICO|nr:alpha/beta fold hydrolase [Brachybacterium vulturis]ATG50945.1 osmotically inducible protein OsmC [Brachybacterium vulturis]